VSTVSVEAATTRKPSTSLTWVISDAWVITKRNLLQYVRIPSLLVFSTIQPVMFVLLFRYVFGGAINVPGVRYVDFLMPGIFVQTSVFGAVQTGIGLADDLSKGLIDRFRSLPMARSAVLAGRTASDSARNLFVILLMTGVGYLVGFRFHVGFLAAVGAIVLALAFGHAFSWISASIGLAIRNVESVQAASFVWIFPLTFASAAFVPVASMPGWLQAWAKVNPVTITVDAMRALTLPNQPIATHVLQAIAWIAGLMIVFVPMAIRRYRRTV